MITLDASVWINSISPSEPGHDASRRFVDHVVAAELAVIVPTILRVEIAATFARAGNYAASVKEAVERFAAFRFVRWIPLDEYMTGKASDMAASHRLRGADAIYAAVASEFNCTLVSLDNEHLARLVGVLDVVTPDTALARLKNPAP
jgi:predicted nucleic acid-binding protein